MKILLIFALLAPVNFAVASDKRIKTITASGFKEITLFGILNPFGGTVESAQEIAKKELQKKCKDELNGQIVGEIKFKTIRFHSGIMGAEVEATGNCEY